MSETVKKFRLIEYDLFSGSMNMAIDEAILDSYIEGTAQPTLRFYGWKPGALSIGYGQKLPSKIAARCSELGLDIVRRPTGGRAVLHQNEFTYSFVCGTKLSDLPGGFLDKSILVAYKQICQGLILGFKELGLEVSIGASSKSYRDFDDCFMATTTADLHIDGRKLVGSAQLRRGEAVLQHGSIVLDQDQELLSSIFGMSQNKDNSVRHANLYKELNQKVSEATLAKAFTKGFEEAFNCSFEKEELTVAEVDKAKSIASKFSVEKSLSG